MDDSLVRPRRFQVLASPAFLVCQTLERVACDLVLSAQSVIVSYRIPSVRSGSHSD